MAWYRTAPQTVVIPSANGITWLTNMDTALTAICGDANFGWQKATYQSTSPRYICLKPKSGAAGRLLFFSGDSPSSSAYYSPGAGSSANAYCFGYDAIATSDTITQSYVTGPPFGGTNNLTWAGTLGPGAALTIELRGYWNATENVMVLVAYNVGTGIHWLIAVGDFLRDDAGNAARGVILPGQSATGSAWPALSYGAPYTYNSTGHPVLLTRAWEPTANSGTGALVQLLQQTNTAALNMGSYTGDTGQYTLPSGLHLFHPIVFVGQVSGFPWSFNRRAWASRFIGYGPPKVKDHEWLDNASASQGFYLGYTNTASSDRSCLSLINYDF